MKTYTLAHHYQQKSLAPPQAQVCVCETQNQQK